MRTRELTLCAAAVLGLGLGGMTLRSEGRGSGPAAGVQNHGLPGGQDEHWRIYRNQRWGFCVAYPAAWSLHEGFDMAGMSASPRQETATTNEIVVSAGALPDQLVGTTSGPPRTLEQNFEVDLQALRESHARRIRVLREQATKFWGNPALVTSKRWTDPKSGKAWAEDTLWINKKQVVYTVGLKCPLTQLSRLEPIHRKMVETLTLNCRAPNSSR